MTGCPHRNRPGRRGVAMLLVIVAMAVAVVLSGVYLGVQSTAARVARNLTGRARARFLAESGLEMALAYVQRDEDWRTNRPHGLWIDEHPYAGGTFSVFGEDGEDLDGDGVVDGDGDLSDEDMDMLTLTCVGTCNGCKHVVQGVVPPTKWALMIVNDPNSLSSEDTDRHALLAKWGWKVRLLRTKPTLEEFNAAVDGIHVVYFSAHTALEPEVKDELKVRDLPVVIEHSKLVDELKVASGESKDYEGASIEIKELTRTVTDEFGTEHTQVYTHFITEPFPVGELPICSSLASLLRLDGTIIGTTALATRVGISDHVAFSYLEAGALQEDKKPARARRVALPWGRKEFSFSIASLNENGRALLQRSLDWAGSSWKGYLPGLAVWDIIEVKDVATVDGFASAVGAAGGENVNQDGTLSTNAVSSDKLKLSGGITRGHLFTSPDADAAAVVDISGGAALTGGLHKLSLNVPIPTPEVEAGLPPSMGDWTYGPFIYYVSSDRHFNKLKLVLNATVHITGDVRFLCDDEVVIEHGARLIVHPGCRLTVYTQKKVELKDSVEVNVSGSDPTRLSWIMLKDKLIVGGDAKVYATVQTYDGELEVKDTGSFCGTFLGKKAVIRNSGAFHIDTSNSGTIVTLGGGFDLSKITGKTVRVLESN